MVPLSIMQSTMMVDACVWKWSLGEKLYEGPEEKKIIQRKDKKCIVLGYICFTPATTPMYTREINGYQRWGGGNTPSLY